MNNPDELKIDGENLSQETPEQAEISRQLREMAQSMENNNTQETENSSVENGANRSEIFLTGRVLKGGEFSIRELQGNPDKIIRTESMVGSVEQTVEHCTDPHM